MEPIDKFKQAITSLPRADRPPAKYEISAELDDIVAAAEAYARERVVAELTNLLKHGKFITEKGYYCFGCNTVTHPSQYKGIPITCTACGNTPIYTPMSAARECIKRLRAQLQEPPQ